MGSLIRWRPIVLSCLMGISMGLVLGRLREPCRGPDLTDRFPCHSHQGVQLREDEAVLDCRCGAVSCISYLASLFA